MAHLWVRNEEERWAILPLDHDGFSLSSWPPKAIARQPNEGAALADVVLVCTRITGPGDWVLIARGGTGVTVNGIPLATGIRVVVDRDLIRVPSGDDFYFSTESLARVEEFPGSDQVLFCPRCKQGIEPPAAAVKCPACGVWHHQTDELACWTYAEVCALCTQPTDLNSGFRWTPEDEEE